MKNYKLFLWGIFIILVLSGCEHLEVDSPTENEVFTEMNSNLILRSATNPNPINGTIYVQQGENLGLKVESRNSAIKNATWVVEENNYKGAQVSHKFKSLGKIDLKVSAEFKNGTSETQTFTVNVGDEKSTNIDDVYDFYDLCIKGPLTVIGETYGMSVSAGTYGISGSGSNYGVHGHGSVGVWGDGTTGVYGTGDIGVSGSGSNYGVKGDGDAYDFYADGSGTNYGPFTGAHDVKVLDDFSREIKKGMIVSVTGENKTRKDEGGNISISSNLPMVSLSNSENDKKVFGVFVMFNEGTEDNWYYDASKDLEKFGIVNALGEGKVWVTNLNGEIEAGDYITTSNIPGYGMKQDDDLLHNYTLGKAIEDIDWDKVEKVVEYNGEKYKVYLISVVYTSG